MTRVPERIELDLDELRQIVSHDILTSTDREKLMAAVETLGFLTLAVENNNVSTLRMRVMALLAYGSGLRISEICQLRVEDIQSDRMMIHVQRGKGERQRRALLPNCALLLLRAYWREYKEKGPLAVSGQKAR